MFVIRFERKFGKHKETIHEHVSVHLRQLGGGGGGWGGERNLRYSLLQSPFILCLVSLFNGLQNSFE